MDLNNLDKLGWAGPFDDPCIAQWVKNVRPRALDLAGDSELRSKWLRHGGTWFAGVNALDNDPSGSVGNSGPLQGRLIDLIREKYGKFEWDAAQISGVYPGYPKQDEGETIAAHRFRKNRDAAHVDGLVPSGVQRRRYLSEPHGFVLGLPITDCNEHASPMVVWNKSHEIMREVFQAEFAGMPSETWSKHDITDVYNAARKHCFDVCQRVVVTAKPGQAYLIHRLALHGVAPWGHGANAPEQGRVILYFRPEIDGGVESWLSAP